MDAAGFGVRFCGGEVFLKHRVKIHEALALDNDDVALTHACLYQVSDAQSKFIPYVFRDP